NLMYIVLTAMLALNVSSDVLNGFNQVHDGLQTTNHNTRTRNEVQLKFLQDLYEKNPAKTAPWYEKGMNLDKVAADLCLSIDSLKKEIAVHADGEEGNPDEIINLDDLEAASVTMLNPASSKGRKLRERIVSFKEFIAPLIADSAKREAALRLLSTDVKPTPGSVIPLSWEEKMFDNMPAVAAVTLLTKLQNDIRQAQGEALASLITNVDIGDVRVNELNAYVIPNSNMVMRGGRYSADIVLAAIDTTQRPAVFVNGSRLANDNGHLELTAGAVGNHEYSGYIEVTRGDGSIDRRPFRSSYTVIEPMATISPTMMNVLYAGIANPISISVPGVPMNAVQATMTNGTLTRNGDTWTAHPGKIGSEAVVTVTASIDGRSQTVGSMTFRVRKLPDLIHNSDTTTPTQRSYALCSMKKE
ncbi:MAG: gliding motility protein GldM, partial [Muribaculaceae bacterium]|nr:gliding motility protein GldM [Muribaculaceae bacterium]